MEPMLKWVGGKRQLLPIISKYIPKYNDYYEPFLGGGAVLFHLKPKKAFVNDLNKKLINVYNIIKYKYDELIDLLKEYQNNISSDFYYKTRDKFNNNISDIESAACFIYLNKTCFNGLYRENKCGKFNASWGKYKNINIFDEKNIKEISNYLYNVIISCGNYIECTKSSSKDDFVYFDPPYYPINKSSFTKYNQNNFLEKQQEELFEEFVRLDKIGCKVLLSNSNTDYIKKLYRGFEIIEISAKRNVNSDHTGRKPSNIEVLIKNYL